jgi:hypothetical protein
VLDALPLADEPRPGNRPVIQAQPARGYITAIELLGEGFESLDSFQL